MRKYLGRRRSDSGELALTPPMTALIVDDETSYRLQLTAIAEKIGFTADSAIDGSSARSMISNARYDLLVVSEETTNLHPLELIAQVRAEEATRPMYTVLITPNDQAEGKVAALAGGFDDILARSAAELSIVGTLVSARRIIARQHAFDQVVQDLYGLASRDELTGVFNRRFFMTETEKLLRQGAAVTIVLFDLDHFKNVNDTYGHLTGDRVLRDVGALFQRRTRPEDLVARYGGDEFVMVVTGEPFYLVEGVASRLVDEIRKLEWSVSPGKFSVGASIGLGSSHFLSDASLPQLLDAADRDLYNKKIAAKARDPKAKSDDRALPLPPPVEERL